MACDVASWYARAASRSGLNKLAKTTAQVLSVSLDGVDLRACVRQARALPDQRVALVRVFAAAREAIRRETGLVLQEAQVLGGLALTQRQVAEMKTGEGKTLALVAPVAWWALRRRGAHVVTANHYLAHRDSDRTRPIFAALGLSVGCVQAGMGGAPHPPEAYAQDITYGVSHEFGFDYLRDLRVHAATERVQRGLACAFVDELDAVLIDDARTPLVLSGPGEDRSREYQVVYGVASRLVPGDDYLVDEKARSATLTDSGYEKAEQRLVEAGVLQTGSALYLPPNAHLATVLARAVQARSLFLRERDYLVTKGEVVLLDATTGRLQEGRRLESGLHEMLEAKEAVAIRPTTQVLGAITYQNFFALYEHLSGLTGTAMTEADELREVYGLRAVAVPTNKPVRRVERADVLVATRAEKLEWVVETARECADTGQPLLVGTESVRDARQVAASLRRAGLAPALLTAEHIAHEAEIVAKAGTRGALTVATAMAGRGTDIVLGGPSASADEARALSDLGGLFVVGFGRNSLRRVDLQLTGRCARQGDRGTAQFILSLEDDLLRRLSQHTALRRVAGALTGGTGLKGELISGLVSAAQRAAERQGREARQSLQKFDQVVGAQRAAFFGWRDTMFEPSAAALFLSEGGAQYARAAVLRFLDECTAPAQWPLLELKGVLRRLGAPEMPLLRWAKEAPGLEDIAARAAAQVREALAQVSPAWAQRCVLSAADTAWSQHLEYLDELGFAARLAASAGKNPRFEFAQRAFKGFEHLMDEVVETACSAAARPPAPAPTNSDEADGSSRVGAALAQRPVARNEPCPCASGRQFKHCHGELR